MTGSRCDRHRHNLGGTTVATGTRRRLPRQRPSDVSLDGVQLAALFRGGEAGGMTGGVSACGSTDAMHVVLGGLR